MFYSAIKSVHFVGIGGTGMAAAAAAMPEKGFCVTGSDQNVYPPMSTFLAEKKIAVMNGYAERNLAHRPDLVVIGNAISRGNPEAEFVLDQKLRYCSLPELLKEFFIRGKRSIVVAGTHGKTTTTSLLAWVFEHSGLNPCFFIGGIPNIQFTQKVDVKFEARNFKLARRRREFQIEGLNGIIFAEAKAFHRTMRHI